MGQHLVDFVFQYLTGTYYRGSLIENFKTMQMFKTIKSPKYVWPQIWTLSHASMADFLDFLLWRNFVHTGLVDIQLNNTMRTITGVVSLQVQIGSQFWVTLPLQTSECNNA